MGAYDTIYFDKNFTCPVCQEKIDSIQVKEFENLFENYHVKDCVSHAEDVRIIKDELFCNHCLTHTGKNIYITVNRGILIGIAESLEEGKKLIDAINLEKLILWYHDQYNRYKIESSKKNSYKKFLLEVSKWFGEKLYEKPPTGLSALFFIENSSFLKSAKDPVESIEMFLSYDKMKEVLNDLWSEGHEILDIYYLEEINPGDESWYVDVYQDDINERCNSNWTWTVISRKELEKEGEKEEEIPEWEILVDEPFSEEVVIKAVKQWLNERGYKFEIKMISMEEAEAKSRSIKELNKRLNSERLKIIRRKKYENI